MSIIAKDVVFAASKKLIAIEAEVSKFLAIAAKMDEFKNDCDWPGVGVRAVFKVSGTGGLLGVHVFGYAGNKHAQLGSWLVNRIRDSSVLEAAGSLTVYVES